jgi:hypothetical protein
MGGMYGYSDVGEFGFSTAIMTAIMAPIMGIIFLFIGAAIFYIIYKVLGGSGSYEGTVRFLSYASAVMVVSWIPLIGLVFGFYQLYLYIVGGMIVHNVSMAKSAIAVLLPTFLVILLVMVAAVFFVSSVFSALI